MLNEKTLIANNLGIECSHRHNTRNLRAKVRSMLPQEICPKQSKRMRQSLKFELFLRPRAVKVKYSHHQQKDKKQFKQLQKLTEKELEQINENKYYFLGNQKIIQQFDHFVQEFHPKIKHQWSSPNLKQSEDMPFGFVPPSFSALREKGSRRSLTPSKKSGSTATSVYLQKSQQVVHRQISSQCQNYKDLAASFMQRRQGIQQEQKVKRQINSVHLQRQQHLAEINRSRLLKLKIEKVKNANSLTKFSKYKEKGDLNHVFEQRDVLSLAAKLRKICIKKYKANEVNACQQVLSD